MYIDGMKYCIKPSTTYSAAFYCGHRIIRSSLGRLVGVTMVVSVAVVVALMFVVVVGQVRGILPLRKGIFELIPFFLLFATLAR